MSKVTENNASRQHGIPDVLRTYRQWVGWKFEKRDGEPTKPPINPHKDGYASSTDSATWGTLEDAQQAAENRGLDGIGFVVTGEDPFSGVDLDGCRDPETGEIASWAQQIVSDLNSYTEVTPSGAGVRVLVRGTLPANSRHKVRVPNVAGVGGREPCVELYDKKRYFTVTGQHVTGTPLTIEDRQEALSALHLRLFGENMKVADADKPEAVALDFTTQPSDMDKLLAERILSEHPAILQSWASDESKGDYAFVCKVIRHLLQAFGSQVDDVDLMQMADRVFRASALFARPDRQEKWMRSAANYAAMTLSRAVREVRAETGENIRAQDDLREYGHARELARQLAKQILWIVEWRAWLEWTGQMWQAIPEERLLVQASEMLRHTYTERANDARTPDEQKHLLKRALEVCTPRLVGVLKFLSGWAGVSTHAEDLDCDSWLFNVQNGTLDLKTLVLNLHDPKDRITKLAKVAYDPGARSEKWHQFLARILPDQDVRRYLQRQLGKAMVGAVLEERLDIWYGTGANGKTTLSRVIMELFGDYALRAAPNLLVASSHDRHPTEIAELVGSRLIFSVEVDQGKRLAEALVKDLTGGDRKKGRFMHGNFFEFPQTFDIVLIVNHQPVILGCDAGIWRRIRLVPFTEQIPESERRPQDELVEELLAEGPAILNWLIGGLEDYQRYPTWVPRAVLAATSAYRGDQDRIAQFIDDCCETGPEHSVAFAVLYSEYEEWCHATGTDPEGKSVFGRLLREHGFSSGRKGGMRVRLWYGLRLKKNDLSKTG